MHREPNSAPDARPVEPVDRFLVCGLGSLGQHCVAILKGFDVTVTAIEQSPPAMWEIDDLPHLLYQMWVGDCRQTDWLEKAGIKDCRAILVTTENERVNIETALAARLLNPQIRLVVRSSKQKLNQLLTQQLGNFVAFEPTQLSAPAFAIAALDEEILGFFTIANELFQVVQHEVKPETAWCNTRKLHELNSRTRRVLLHRVGHSSPIAAQIDQLFVNHQQFHQWEPEHLLQSGDVVVTVEPFRDSEWRSPNVYSRPTQRSVWPTLKKFGRFLSQGDWKRAIATLWQLNYQNQIRRVAILCGITVLLLLAIGTLLFSITFPGMGSINALYATAVLLLGGYGDLFGDLQPIPPLPWWLRLFGFSLTLAGTAFVGVLYALLTEKLLTARFQFLTRRPPVPQQGHVVIVGLGRVGQQVGRLLQDMKQAIVGVTDIVDSTLLPNLPVVTGELASALAKVRLASAKSVVAVTEDEMQNLEIGLMAHAANNTSRLIIRTYDRHFSDNVARLFPYAQVLCASELSAEVFAAAAFGENVLGLFRLNNRTIMVTEYRVEAGDNLDGLLIAEAAYGYGIVPLAFSKTPADSLLFFPSDDDRLQPGNYLIVLASINGLKRIERGELNSRDWQVSLETVTTREACFEGANAIARMTGYSLNHARDLMNHLPATLPTYLYKHQAFQLVRQLKRVRVKAQAVLRPLSDPT